MDNICIDNPLASSTQQGELSDSTTSKDGRHLYKTQTWQLTKFSRFCEQDASSTNSDGCIAGDENCEQSSAIEWEEWTNQPSLELVVRLAGFGHLAVMYGSQILESYFLILSKKWLKSVSVDDEIMLLIKHSKQTKRLRLTFQSESDSTEFYKILQKFTPTTSGHHLNPSSTTSDRLSEYSATEPIDQVMTLMETGQDTSWTTEWPTRGLEGLVRLCLADPNFPGFVKHVDRLVKKLTTPLVVSQQCSDSSPQNE